MKLSVQRPPILTLSEWQSLHLEGVALDAEDRNLVELLSNGAERRIGIDELRTGLRINARSWVGVVRLSSCEIRVVPKLVGGDVGLVKLIDFAAGLHALDRYPAIHTFDAGGGSLLDLVALLLAEACERIARGGLLADYCEVEDDIPVMRGRLLVRKQVLERFGRIDRLECRYDQHTTNTLANQLLLAALSACAGRIRHPSVAQRVRRLLAIFSEACSADDLDLRLLRATMTYNRLNEHYRESHQLAWLVLDGLGIDDIYGGSNRCFAFLLDMNRLFEDFITKWFMRLTENSPYRVLAQRRDRTILWNADLSKPYTHVIPDALIEHANRPGIFLPVDAKYKLYDGRNISPADIYQTFLYSFAYGADHISLPSAVILYPASSPNAGTVRLHIRQTNGIANAEIRGIGIHVPSALVEAMNKRVGAIGQALLDQIGVYLEHPIPRTSISTASPSNVTDGLQSSIVAEPDSPAPCRPCDG